MWNSNAEWPVGTCSDTTITTDTHQYKEQAQAVCDLLERMGFGGDGKVFPVRTWVEVVEKRKEARVLVVDARMDLTRKENFLK